MLVRPVGNHGHRTYEFLHIFVRFFFHFFFIIFFRCSVVVFSLSVELRILMYTCDISGNVVCKGLQKSECFCTCLCIPNEHN